MRPPILTVPRRSLQSGNRAAAKRSVGRFHFYKHAPIEKSQKFFQKFFDANSTCHQREIPGVFAPLVVPLIPDRYILWFAHFYSLL